MSTIWAFDGIENKHDVYQRYNCMKRFCKSLKEHVVKISNFGKKKIIPLTNKETKTYGFETCVK